MPVIVSPGGVSGPRGNSILNGIGAPDTVTGVDGDWYIDRTAPAALVMYGPKTAGDWGAGTGFGTPPSWLPADSGLAWGSYAPILAGQAIVPPAGNAGQLTLQRALLRQPATLATIWFGVSAGDSSHGMTNCYLGLYDSAGTLRARTADLSTVFQTAGVYGQPFLAPYTAPAGEYFIGLVLGGTWTNFNLKESHGGITTNAGLTPPHLALSNLGTGLNALPATINLTSQTTTLIADGWGSQWYGLS